MKINKKHAKELVLMIVGDLDYDLVKTLHPETAENPKAAVETLNALAAKVQAYLDMISVKG